MFSVVLCGSLVVFVVDGCNEQSRLSGTFITSCGNSVSSVFLPTDPVFSFRLISFWCQALHRAMSLERGNSSGSNASPKRPVGRKTAPGQLETQQAAQVGKLGAAGDNDVKEKWTLSQYDAENERAGRGSVLKAGKEDAAEALTRSKSVDHGALKLLDNRPLRREKKSL